MSNQKYEITDIVHEKYPFLHRIRALRDIGDKVRAGDLGGFVEHEDNLSFKPGDDAWIFGDAIAAGCACVDQGARLFGKATVCDHTYVSQGAEMSGEARAEDFAYIRGSVLCGHARAAGQSMILNSTDTGRAPSLSENCVVYGTVMGDIHVMGKTVILGEEKIAFETLDTLILNGQERSIIRASSRDDLAPAAQRAEEKKPKRKEQAR